MDHQWVFNDFVHKSVEASIVKADDQEGIDCANGVVRLSFFNIGVICAHKNKRLGDLDVVEVANKTILAVSHATSKINAAKDTINELDEVDKNAYSKKCDTSFLVLFLNFSELFNELSFFLHEACLLFATVLLHFLTNSFDIRIAHRFIRKNILNFLAGSLLFVFATSFIHYG